MASTTTATALASTSQIPPQPQRASFSASAATDAAQPQRRQLPANNMNLPDAAPTTSSAPMHPPHQTLQRSSSQHSASQSFTMSQPSSQQGGVPSTSVYRPYNDAQARMAQENAMPIFTATYSGVNVYEMEVNNVAVMRRQHDSWLNATQILKVAGVDKGRRTKILEKEIQTGTHEKVQGGYGKYQGTWIPFDRGLEICRLYGVEDLLQTLLTHNIRPDGLGAHTADIDTPTKEQAMAAQRKRMYNNTGTDQRPNGLLGGGTFFKNISDGAAHAVAAISKARFDSPGPRSSWNGSQQQRAPSFHRQPSSQSVGDQQQGGSQPAMYPDGTLVEGGPSSQQGLNGDGTEPPRKRQRITMTPADSFGYSQSQGEIYANTFPGSPTEPNESFIYSQAGINMQPDSANMSFDGRPCPLRPLPFEKTPNGEAKRSRLMGLFMDPGPVDPANMELLRSMTSQELDAPLDAQMHTAMHWAATLSRMSLLRALSAAGANPFRVNASGETALMRACIVTNSMDLNSFPELLDVLGATIEVRDDKGRTVLHHIALTSAVKGRNLASRYYLESLLEWVVRQGPSSQATNGLPRMNLGRFMSEIVNAQDHGGDTALNIAARISNRSVISQLLEVGADPDMPNRIGLRPRDFGVGKEGDAPNGASKSQLGGTSAADASAGKKEGKKRHSSEEVVTSITHLLGESSNLFQSELRKKQLDVEYVQASLRTATSQSADTRRAIEAAEAKLRVQQLARQKAANLAAAVQEEEFRLLQLEQSRGRLNVDAMVAWETATEAAVKGTNTNIGEAPPSLPSAAVLLSRAAAVRSRAQETRRAVAGLRTRSRDLELKYRKLVALCVAAANPSSTADPVALVDTLVDGLTRAVESERAELEIARVRRFLGGVGVGQSAVGAGVSTQEVSGGSTVASRTGLPAVAAR